MARAAFATPSALRKPGFENKQNVEERLSVFPSPGNFVHTRKLEELKALPDNRDGGRTVLEGRSKKIRSGKDGRGGETEVRSKRNLTSHLGGFDKVEQRN